MSKPKPIAWYRPGRAVISADGYRYTLGAPYGADFDSSFQPQLSPEQMLERGVFEGKYMNDARGEFPIEWFRNARLSLVADPLINEYKIKSRLSLDDWKKKGWIHKPDKKGWFEWYCRYYVGRRIPDLDALQIKRWRAFRRHAGQIRRHCSGPLLHDMTCRARQKQALLQWAYDPKAL